MLHPGSDLSRADLYEGAMTIGIFICWAISILALLCIAEELTKISNSAERIANALENRMGHSPGSRNRAYYFDDGR